MLALEAAPEFAPAEMNPAAVQEPVPESAPATAQEQVRAPAAEREPALALEAAVVQEAAILKKANNQNLEIYPSFLGGREFPRGGVK